VVFQVSVLKVLGELAKVRQHANPKRGAVVGASGRTLIRMEHADVCVP
jgi:hypothetical protein